MAIVRVVDQYNFPQLLRELGRAVRGGDTNIAAIVDRANTFVLCLADLPPSDRLAITELSKKKGMDAILARARDPEAKEEHDVVVMGTFTQYLDLINDVKELGTEMLHIGSEMKRAIFDYRERVFELETPGGDVLLGRDTVVMGIVNVTPDSFSDGGETVDTEAAVEHAKKLVEDGAAIIDIGGESTRPGAEPVSVDEEQSRIMPVIETLFKEEFPVPICVDTRNSSTAEKALEAGASMINDVSGLRHDGRMIEVVKRAAVPFVLMHSRGTPQDMQTKTDYYDLIPEIITDLRLTMGRCRKEGIDMSNVILDPGLGFAKTSDQSIEIIRRLSEFRTLGRPLMIGPSRKSFLSKLGAEDLEERKGLATAAIVTCCAYAGAHIVRVHDVAQAVKVLQVVDGVRRLV